MNRGEKDGLIKEPEETFRGGGHKFIVSIVTMVSREYTSTLIKLYALNICSLLQDNCISR